MYIIVYIYIKFCLNVLNVALLEVQNDLQYSSPGNLHYDTCEGVGSLSLIIMLILMKGYEH